MAAEESLLIGLAVNVRFLHSRHQVLARPQRVLPLTRKILPAGQERSGVRVRFSLLRLEAIDEKDWSRL